MIPSFINIDDNTYGCYEARTSEFIWLFQIECTTDWFNSFIARDRSIIANTCTWEI